MKLQNLVKKHTTSSVMITVQKREALGSISFAKEQFSQLSRRHLGLPVRLYNL